MRDDREERDPARERTPERFGGLLGDLVRRKGWSRRLEGARVHECWDEIAGPELAPHCEPVRLVGGVLLVRAAKGPWATQLGFLTTELAERANTVLGPGTVERVKIVT